MIKNTSYVHGTAAEKMQFDVYQENKVLKAKKSQKSYLAVKFKAVLCLAIVFMLGTLVMFKYAQITKLNYDISKKQKAYNDVIKDNDRLKIKIDQAMDLQKIKEIAEGKLGMQKPEKYQTNYVTVNKMDNTKVSSEYAGKTDNNVLSKLTKLFGLIH